MRIEIMTSSSFTELLNAEIERVKTEKNPPAAKTPLSLADYQTEILATVEKPTPAEIKAFADAIKNSHTIVGMANVKIVPVLIPHEHGYSTFEDDRVNKFGYLYWYLINDENYTIRDDNQVYLDAILPEAIIKNVVRPPQDLSEKEAERFHRELDAAIETLLSWQKEL